MRLEPLEERPREVDRDGKEVPLSAACIFRMDGDLIADYRIYMDISPLYA